jgi:hypothetical protein
MSTSENTMRTRRITVELPTPDGPDEDGRHWFDDNDYGWVSVRPRSPEVRPSIWLACSELTLADARSLGLALLAAAELVDEAGA